MKFTYHATKICVIDVNQFCLLKCAWNAVRQSIFGFHKIVLHVSIKKPQGLSSSCSIECSDLARIIMNQQVSIITAYQPKRKSIDITWLDQSESVYHHCISTEKQEQRYQIKKINEAHSLVHLPYVLDELQANGTFLQIARYAFFTDHQMHAWQNYHITFVRKTYATVLYSPPLLLHSKQSIHALILDPLQLLFTVMILLQTQTYQRSFVTNQLFTKFEQTKTQSSQLFCTVLCKQLFSLDVVQHLLLPIKEKNLLSEQFHLIEVLQSAYSSIFFNCHMTWNLNQLSSFSAYLDFRQVSPNKIIQLILQTFHDVLLMIRGELKKITLICYQNQQISITIIKHILNQLTTVIQKKYKSNFNLINN